MKVGDAKTVRDLVETLFADPSIYRMPEVMAAVVKQRLIDAQIAYLDGKASGVIEGAVVDAMNALATTFDAPDYAMVSTLQVRFLRNRLASGMPVFMGSVPEAKADEPNSPMSPLQAMFLMSVLINQKRLNPDDQVPPVEWDRDFYPRLLEQARAADELRKRVEAGEAKYEVKARLFALTTRPNLELILRQHIQQMSIGDGLKLFNDTFARQASTEFLRIASKSDGFVKPSQSPISPFVGVRPPCRLVDLTGLRTDGTCSQSVLLTSVGSQIKA